ncbi:MAG: hypothetical protein IJ122_06225 [Methanobrevibacter sp.]|nr:hypothetical protein [Methanobrevibacter sp.]
MIYYTSDLHFGHKNILKWENRKCSTVDEMDKMLIDNWNSKVLENDEVYVLGDVSFYQKFDKNRELIQSLHGKKFLIKGNHDFGITKYCKDLFEKILPYMEIKDENREVMLFHYPIFNWNKQQYGTYHCYGHVHSNEEFQLNIKNSFNVGVDVNNYFPVTLDELIEKQNESF